MKKLCGIVALCLLLVVMLSGCSVQLDFHYFDAEQYSVGNAEITQTVEKLDVEWASGDVRILSWQGDTVKIEETISQQVSDSMQMRYLMDGTTLRVRFMKPGALVSVPFVHKALTVYLPQNLTLRSLEVETASADIRAEGVSAQNVELEAASGDINASLEQAATVDCDTASGNVDVFCRSVLDDLDADTASGDIFVRLEQFPVCCSFDTASGKMMLVLPIDAGFTASVDTVSGDFHTDFPVSKSGSNYLCGDGSSSLSFESASGDVSILFSSEEA